MPTSVRKHSKAHRSGETNYRNPHFHVAERASGAVKSHHATRTKAEGSQSAREGGRRGWKPTRGK